MKKDNEINAINATIKIYEKFLNIDLKDASQTFPDDIVRNIKEIDCIIKNQKTRIAIEHSIIEHYDCQLQYLNKSYDIVQNINKSLQETLLNDRHYVILIPPNLIINKNKYELKQLSKEIIKSIKEKIATLAIDESFIIKYKTEKISVFCKVSSLVNSGNLYRAPTVPGDGLEKLIKVRVNKLFEDKLDKSNFEVIKRYLLLRI